MNRIMTSGTRVYVGNLIAGVLQVDLEREFGRFGKLREVWVARNPPGFAFIEFFAYVDAERAISSLNGRQVCGSKVTVQMSKNPIERQQSRRKGGRRQGRLQGRQGRQGRDRGFGGRHQSQMPRMRQRKYSLDHQDDQEIRPRRPTPPPLLPKAITAKAQLAKKLKRRARNFAKKAGRRAGGADELPKKVPGNNITPKKNGKPRKGRRKKTAAKKKMSQRLVGEDHQSRRSISLSPVRHATLTPPRRGPMTPPPLDRLPAAPQSPRNQRQSADLSPGRMSRPGRQLSPLPRRSPPSRRRRHSRSPEPRWDFPSRYTTTITPPYGRVPEYELSSWYPYTEDAMLGGDSYRKKKFPPQEGPRGRLPRNRSRSPARSPVRSSRSSLPHPRYLPDLWDLPFPPLPPPPLDPWGYKGDRRSPIPYTFRGGLPPSQDDPLPRRSRNLPPSPRSYGLPRARNARSPPRDTYKRRPSPYLPLDLPYPGIAPAYFRGRSPSPPGGYKGPRGRSPPLEPTRLDDSYDRRHMLGAPSPLMTRALPSWPRTNSPYSQHGRAPLLPAVGYKRSSYSPEEPRQKWKGRNPSISPPPKSRPKTYVDDSPSPRRLKTSSQYRSPSLSPPVRKKKRYMSRSPSPGKPKQYRLPSPASPRGQGRLALVPAGRARDSISSSPSPDRKLNRVQSSSSPRHKGKKSKSKKQKSISSSPPKYSSKRRSKDSSESKAASKKKNTSRSSTSRSVSPAVKNWDSSPQKPDNIKTTKGSGYSWSSDSEDDWNSSKKKRSNDNHSSRGRNSSFTHRVKSYELQMSKSGPSNYKMVKTTIHETKYHDSPPSEHQKKIKSSKKAKHSSRHSKK